jgi:hypothetical protein
MEEISNSDCKKGESAILDTAITPEYFMGGKSSPSLRSTPYATPLCGDKTMRCMVLWAYPKRPRMDAGLSTPRPESPKQDAEDCRETPATPPGHSGDLRPVGFLDRLK